MKKKIRDLYRSAVETIDDPRGKDLFQALADDEQNHVAFLEHGLTLLKENKDQELKNRPHQSLSRPGISK